MSVGCSVGRWKAVAVALLSLTCLSSTACSFLLPSRPLSSVYVINIDGHVIVRSRCSVELTDVEVSWRTGEGEPHPPNVWVAHANPPGVGEFWLFSPQQPGVEVEVNDPPPPGPIEWVVVEVTYASGHSAAVGYSHDGLKPGWVDGELGLMPASDFLAIRSSQFGC